MARSLGQRPKRLEYCEISRDVTHNHRCSYVQTQHDLTCRLRYRVSLLNMRRYCAHIAFSISHFLGLHATMGRHWCAYQDAKLSKKGAKCHRPFPDLGPNPASSPTSSIATFVRKDSVIVRPVQLVGISRRNRCNFLSTILTILELAVLENAPSGSSQLF